ncbi:GMC family oxidoreductase N-terminal domain-containing protein [Achromobacter insolitus]|uniref:GMC family oxidoreductase n=1 Tax=Achromobacter insolitus TaxID=217204 RepID=UPI0009728351|nr:GMC family oxidoreductase N-terminal domain-containing protein [Achromobacter insolitus]APX77477.1 choline dehydrogenase [Achromobacter insolitus]AXA73351.1 choline dehydrogenase [Achromobacter insolitus]MDH3066974.1 GMC family oxidoreductase N-terminal domain-containing protein [Achromobacter insolitus]OWT55876.1 choline dehydrogenase [Achromobacter insolitus]QEK95337.1 choline dehydrogenase [Achromobacter insolitus]
MSQAQPSLRDADQFDYVIVGSGAAGSILANRLSADGSTVCVLEAGPPDRSPYLHIPAGFIKAVFNKKYAWQFSSEGTAQTNGRRVPIPQGRTLGGSTSINGLVYNRGQAADFDHWAALGNTGWSYDEVLPYFKSMERRVGGEDRYRGRKGELPVTDIDWIHPLCEAFIAGAVEQGIPRNPDYNGAEQAGVGYFQRTIDRGWRMSTAKCFLKPAMGRKNLEVRTYAQATRILFDGGKAAGVAYCHPAHPSQVRAVRARREVIVSCGAINTPKLLQLSGLGPAELLRQHNIDVVCDLPGVGENLSDHYSVRVVARVKNSQTMNQLVKGLSLAGQISRWLMKRPSIMALSPSLLHYFWKSTPDLALPDLQGVFTPASYKEGYVGMLDDFPGMTAGVWQHRPESRGQVRIRSADPLQDPVILANYLENERDQMTLVRGIRLARQLLRSQALSPYFESEVLPGPMCESDSELLDFARRYGVSSYHVNGTARMGQADDKYAVVDPQLRVHGVGNLRVIDSSVMPAMPSANICAATMMIGNKAADLIKQS